MALPSALGSKKRVGEILAEVVELDIDAFVGELPGDEDQIRDKALQDLTCDVLYDLIQQSCLDGSVLANVKTSAV